MCIRRDKLKMEEKKKKFIEKIKQNQVKIIVIALFLFGMFNQKI